MSVDDIDELFMLLSLLVADLSVPVALLFMLLLVDPVPVVAEPVFEPVTDPVERVVLPFVVAVVPVAVLPAFGPEFDVSLLGEPEAPP